MAHVLLLGGGIEDEEHDALYAPTACLLAQILQAGGVQAKAFYVRGWPQMDVRRDEHFSRLGFSVPDVQPAEVTPGDIKEYVAGLPAEAPLVLVLLDHGSRMGFLLGEHSLGPEELVSIVGEVRPVLLVYDACAGSAFIGSLPRNIGFVGVRNYTYSLGFALDRLSGPFTTTLTAAVCAAIPLDAGFEERLHQRWASVLWDKLSRRAVANIKKVKSANLFVHLPAELPLRDFEAALRPLHAFGCQIMQLCSEGQLLPRSDQPAAVEYRGECVTLARTPYRCSLDYEVKPAETETVNIEADMACLIKEFGITPGEAEAVVVSVLLGRGLLVEKTSGN